MCPGPWAQSAVGTVLERVGVKGASQGRDWPELNQLTVGRAGTKTWGLECSACLRHLVPNVVVPNDWDANAREVWRRWNWRGEVSCLLFFGSFYESPLNLVDYTPPRLLAFKPLSLQSPLISNNTSDLKGKVGGSWGKNSPFILLAVSGIEWLCSSCVCVCVCVWKLHHIQTLRLWTWHPKCPQLWGKMTLPAIWVWQAFLAGPAASQPTEPDIRHNPVEITACPWGRLASLGRQIYFTVLVLSLSKIILFQG